MLFQILDYSAMTFIMIEYKVPECESLVVFFPESLYASYLRLVNVYYTYLPSRNFKAYSRKNRPAYLFLQETINEKQTLCREPFLRHQ